MRSGCGARLWLRWLHCGCVMRGRYGRMGSTAALPQVIRLLRHGLREGNGLRLPGSRRPDRKSSCGRMGMYPMGNFRVGCRAGLFRVAWFSGLGIRLLAILMELMHGRGILLGLRRVQPTAQCRMVRRFDPMPIRELRPRGIWATGSISIGIFRRKTRSGLCATTRASGGFNLLNRTGWCSSCIM
jgi:hypothetical protein